jgi:hypothetical protein
MEHNMKLSKIWESRGVGRGHDEFILELLFVGPKSKGSSKIPWSDYGYYSINTELLENPEYFDRAKVLVLTDLLDSRKKSGLDAQTKAIHPLLQRLKNLFKQQTYNNITHAELIFEYEWTYDNSIEPVRYGGEKVANVAPVQHDEFDMEATGAYLLFYNPDGSPVLRNDDVLSSMSDIEKRSGTNIRRKWYLQSDHAMALFEVFKHDVEYHFDPNNEV